MKTKVFKYGLFFLILFFGVALTSCDDKDKDEEKEEVVFDERIEKYCLRIYVCQLRGICLYSWV